MKITPSLILLAPDIITPEGKLALVLRDQALLDIENLYPFSSIYSVIDLTNNDILELENVPDTECVETLLLANNNISFLGAAAFANGTIDAPNGTLSSSTTSELGSNQKLKKTSSLLSLLLVNNNISSFTELCKLHRFCNLRCLLMMGNPICNENHYRVFTIWILPKLRVLDGERVTRAERTLAMELFGASLDERSIEANELLHKTAETSTAPKQTRLMADALKKLTPEEKKSLVAQLELALTMEEMERISLALRNGYVL